MKMVNITTGEEVEVESWQVIVEYRNGEFHSTVTIDRAPYTVLYDKTFNTVEAARADARRMYSNLLCDGGKPVVQEIKERI